MTSISQPSEKSQSQSSQSTISATPKENASAAPQPVSAGEWLRLMTNFSAPFGHDRMPTVWG